MTRDPILIRLDATAAAGYERYARGLVTAAAIQRRRRPTFFLSQFDPTFLAQAVKRGGNDWVEAEHKAGSAQDLKQTLREIRRLKPAAVIVDAEVSQMYLAELAAAGSLVMSIDQSAGIRFPSNMILNPLLGPGKESYEFDAGAQLLLGQRYALVRSEIRRLRPVRSQEPAPMPVLNGKGGPFRALLALGEDDPHDQTLELAKILLSAPKIGKVDVVVRRHHCDLDKILDFAETNKDRVELALEPAEIAARVVRCHFALTSGSGWSLELACVGVPQLMILQNESHWPNAQRLEEEGAATCLGWHENVSPQTVRTAIQNLLSDPLERQAMARCGRKLIDGRGPDRLVIALEVMLHAGKKVAATYRAAA